MNQACTVIYADRAYKGTQTDRGILVSALNVILPYPTKKPLVAGKATKGHLVAVKTVQGA